ncbi:MAG: GNAT family N-acetyltransferase [Solobacterium sp.]|nr:GNAT family N-acetyltransferase [Solobacterium sp.]
MKTHIIQNRQDPYLPKVRALYETAFPGNERMPFRMLANTGDPDSELLVFLLDDDRFAGFARMFHHPSARTSFLSYLAIEEDLRGRGYGTEILKQLCADKHDRKIVLDIEEAVPQADNYEERKQRKQFYLDRGFTALNLRYIFFNVKYELLGTNGQMTLPEFHDLIRHFWGRAAAAMIRYCDAEGHEIDKRTVKTGRG